MLPLTCTGVNCCTVKKYYSGSIAEGSIDHVAVSGNPANVSGAGKDFTRLIVKVILNECMVLMIDGPCSIL